LCGARLFGEREIKQSLGTGNHREALRKARKLATFYQDRFEHMSKYDDYANDPSLEHLKVTIVKFPDGRVELQNLEMDPDKADVEIKLLDHAVERANKVQAAPASGQPPVSPAVTPHQVGQSQIAQPTNAISLSDLVYEYLGVLRGHCDNRTITNYATQLETFVEILGDVPITTIDRKRAREALRILKQLPPNRNKSKVFKDLSIASLIQLEPAKVMSPTTVKLYVERITGLFQFALEEEYVVKNPFTNIIKEKQKRRPDEERQIFSDTHLKALFNPANRKETAGRESRYWIP
jgi:hypothetical protein